MKKNLMNTGKPEECTFVSSFGIDYLNILLKRLIRQKEHSQRHAPGQVMYWRTHELTVRKCIKLAQYFAEQV